MKLLMPQGKPQEIILTPSFAGWERRYVLTLNGGIEKGAKRYSVPPL